MSFFDRLERRCGWLAFPGFLRFYALMHVLVFVLQYIKPDIGLMLDFDRAKIMSGEVWRIITCFFAYYHFGGRGLFSLIFLLCMISFVFMVSDGLEGAWGAFKTSIFYYVGMLTILIANFLYPISIPYSGVFLYLSAFLAFAVMFPKVEILLMMIIPVRIGILGMVVAGGIVWIMIKAPIIAPFVVFTLLNFIIWAGIPAVRGTAMVVKSAKRRKTFTVDTESEGEAFYTCAVCKRTDKSDPNLEFRVGPDGKEYCEEHLPET